MKIFQGAYFHDLSSRISLVNRLCGILSKDKLRRILEDRCEREGRVLGMIVEEGKGGNLGGRGALDRCTASTRRKQTSFSTISPAPSPLHLNILSLSLLHHLSLVVCYDASLWHCYDFDVGNVGFLKL